MADKQVILFGCGEIGREAYDFFGSDLVYCFCDNNTKLEGTEKYGKKVIGFQTLKKIVNDYTLIISMNFHHTEQIIELLEGNGIFDYLPYEEIKLYQKADEPPDELLTRISNPSDRIRLQRDYYKRKAELLEEQYNYLKKHTDITTLKPATGYLRQKQLKTLEFALEFFDYIRELDIKPFLISGSLIGAVRHQGFIPWDDDLDFGLMRDDYKRLISFCKKNLIAEISDNNWNEYSSDVHLKRMGKLTTKYANNFYLDIEADQLQVCRGTSAADRIGLDFFSFDYYANDYTYEEHRAYLLLMDKKRKSINKINEIIDFFDSEIQTNININSTPTNNIYFGIDNMCGYYRLNKPQNFFSYDTVFPLQKHRFENAEFYVPNKTKDFLAINYPDYMEFPKDLGIATHDGYVTDFLKRSMPTAEFYLIDAFEIYHFLPLYYYFLEHGIFANFVAEPPIKNTAGNWFDYNEAIRILENLGVRFSITANKESDFVFTTQRAEVVNKYSGKKVHMAYGFGLSMDSFCESNDTIIGFDYKLVHGNLPYKYIPKKKYTCHILKVGYPKYSKDHPVLYVDCNDDIRVNKEGKPILLYFPTWDKVSSIKLYKDELMKLRKDYFIITKAHHCTYRLKSEKEHLEILESISDIVLPGNYDFLKAALLSNIAICDAISGSATEVPFVNSNIKLLLLYPPLECRSRFRDIISEFAVCVQSPENFKNAFLQVLQGDNKQFSRNKLLKEIYGEYGKCNLDEITQIIRKTKSTRTRL